MAWCPHLGLLEHPRRAEYRLDGSSNRALNHRGHREHRERWGSLCSLCPLWSMRSICPQWSGCICTSMLPWSSPQIVRGSSPAKRYTCAIHPKIRGTNRPPTAVHSSRVVILSHFAAVAPSAFTTPARTESGLAAQKSTCSCQWAMLVGSRESKSAGVAFGGALYIAPTSFIAPLSSFLYSSD